MKRVVVCSLAAGLVAITGCVGPMGPVGGVGAGIYTDVSGPVCATGNPGGTKMGQASSRGHHLCGNGRLQHQDRRR